MTTMRKFLQGGTRVRGLLFLAVLAAAFSLAPASSALAVENVHVTIDGTGSGEVAPIPGSEEFAGTPPLECSYVSPGPPTGTCDTEGIELEPGLIAVGVEAVAAPGSEFTGWSFENGFPGLGCLGTEAQCTAAGLGQIEFKATFNATAGPEEFPLTLSTSGSGTGSFECDTGSGAEACAAEYEEGTAVTVIPTADPGSEFVEWEGDCTGSGACEVTMDEERSVTGVFDLEVVPSEYPLTVNFGGTGTATVQCDTGSGPGACAAEYPEGTTVTVIDTADPGSEFVEWLGDCDSVAGDECEVEMDAAKTVEAINDLEPVGPTAMLSLIKGGYAEGGTVTSSPAGINCGTGCSVQTTAFGEGETVTLTATAASGYVFAGWLNCKYVAAGECEVTAEAPLTEVTAVFIKDGVEGPQGDPGATGPQGPPGNPGTTGPQGPQGNPGTTGPQGNPGATGAQGATGPQGPAGAKGADGANGKDGATGPQGPQGPQGKVKVTCKVKGKKVKCVVKQAASSSARRLRWRLSRAGHGVAHGSTAVRHGQARVALDTSRLQAGRYVLRVQGQKGGVQIAIG